MQNLRALLLDLDDTLLDDRGAMADAVLVFRRRHSFCSDEDDCVISARWDSLGRELWRKMEIGELGFEEQRRQRLRSTFSLRISDSEADELFKSYLECYENSWRLLPGADQFLQQTSDLLRVIVTNGHRQQAQRKLERLGIDLEFNQLVTPEDCGARKPDPRIFQFALDSLQLLPHETMMIGDNEEVDLAPALTLGMRVFHIRESGSGASIQDAIEAILQSRTD